MSDELGALRDRPDALYAGGQRDGSLYRFVE